MTAREATMNRLCVFLHWISLILAAIIVCSMISLFAMSAFVLLTMALKIKNIPDSLVVIPGLGLFFILLAVCIFLAWKFGRHSLVPEETRSRGQSFLLWETAAFPLFLVSALISFYTDLNWPGLVGLSLPVAALIVALAFPFHRFQSGKNGFWAAIRAGGFAAAVLIFFSGMVIPARGGKEVSYQGDDPAGFPPAVRWIGKQYVPAGASGIKLSGRSTSCEWSCRVSGKDFLKFKAKCPFEFSKVEKPCDSFDNGPFPYYSYVNRRGDGGGVSLRYDVKNEHFTGSYSSH